MIRHKCRFSHSRSYCKVTWPHTILLEYLISLLSSSFLRHLTKIYLPMLNANCQTAFSSISFHLLSLISLIMFQLPLSNCYSTKLLSFLTSTKKNCPCWTSWSQNFASINFITNFHWDQFPPFDENSNFTCDNYSNNLRLWHHC